MTTLAWVLALAALVPAGLCTAYGVRFSHTPGAARAKVLTVLAVVSILVLSAAGYGFLGRFSDWDTREVDEFTDWQLVARITEARRAVKADPENEAAQMKLAQSYYAAGLYKDAVDTLDAAVTLCGETQELLSLKAQALYYRDGRRFGPEVRALTERLLRANPYNVEIRLLIANDAFLTGNYQKAIDEWEFLIRSGAAAGQRAALENAVANARSRMTR